MDTAAETVSENSPQILFEVFSRRRHPPRDHFELVHDQSDMAPTRQVRKAYHLVSEVYQTVNRGLS